MPVVALAVLGMSLLMPGAQWTTEGEAVEAAMQQMPGLGPWGIIAVTMASGLLSGVTVNAVFAFGKEIAWRGFLVKELKGKKLLPTALIIGVVWGLWHFPLILNGHNYPDHPVAGVFMMVLMCLAFTPILLYFRQESGSVVVPAMMHGTFNAVVGVSILFVTPYNDLLVGGTCRQCRAAGGRCVPFPLRPLCRQGETFYLRAVRGLILNQMEFLENCNKCLFPAS